MTGIALAQNVTASSCGGVRHKRYSGAGLATENSNKNVILSYYFWAILTKTDNSFCFFYWHKD